MTNKINKPEKLHFLFISSDLFPPSRVDVSILFGEQIAGRGHMIDWLLQSESNCKKAYLTTWNDSGNVWVGAADDGRRKIDRLKSHLSGIANDLRMFKLIRHKEYDVIQVKDKFISALFAIIAARLNKAKLVYWLSYPFPEAALYRVKDGTAVYPFLYLIRGHVFKFLLYRLIMPLSDHIFVQSEQMKKDVAAMGIPDKKITPVPMGVSLETIVTPQLNNSPITMRHPSILYLGTLKKVRKIDFLVRVLAKLHNSRSQKTVLYLVGAGDDPEDELFLRDEVKRLGLEEFVVFTGQLAQAEALHYVQQADVCLSPFYPTPILNSTSPTKLIEYMALSKAVIANDHPEQRLVIQESGAGICVPYDETAFCEAIGELLDHPDKAVEMGRKGRRYVEKNRTYQVIADTVENKYRQICSLSR